MKQFLQVVRKSPTEHRIVATVVLVGIWYVLQFHLHYDMAAKGVEVFGLAPFADRLMSFLLAE